MPWACSYITFKTVDTLLYEWIKNRRRRKGTKHIQNTNIVFLFNILYMTLTTTHLFGSIVLLKSHQFNRFSKQIFHQEHFNFVRFFQCDKEIFFGSLLSSNFQCCAKLLIFTPFCASTQSRWKSKNINKCKTSKIEPKKKIENVIDEYFVCIGYYILLGKSNLTFIALRIKFRIDLTNFWLLNIIVIIIWSVSMMMKPQKWNLKRR